MSWQGLPWIVGPIAVPLLGGLLAFLLARRAMPWLPVLAVAGVVTSLIGLSAQILHLGPLRHSTGGWSAPLGIDLHADGLALSMLWMTAWAGALVSLYALGYFRGRTEQSALFWPVWLLLWAALNALYLSADLFNLYVTLELTTLAGVSLVALAGGGIAFRAALRYLLYAMVGSLAYLLGVALLYGEAGTLDLFLLERAGAPAALPVAAALITGGLLVKTAIFPLHVWLPPAHAGAPTPVSALLSALVVKGSFYLLIRVWFDAWPALLTPAVGQLLGALGALAIVYGSLQALRQPRLKLLVAYSTVAQLGYLMLLFPLGGALAWSGAIYHALSHAMAKSALFLAAGNVLRILGHDRIKELRGMDWGLPLTLFAFGLAGVTIMGLPPSGGFVAKWLLLKAALDGGQWWWAVVILAGGLLAAGYVFRVLRYAFARSEPDARIEAGLPGGMKWAPFLLALSALGLGFAGQPVLSVLGAGAPAVTGYRLLSWSNPLPLLALLTSFGTGIVIFLLGERRHRLRVLLNLGGAVLNLVLAGVILAGVYLGVGYEVRLAVLPGLDLLLRADAFAMLFVTLSAVLWLLTTLYALGYLEGSAHRSRFFGFFSLCVGSTMGVAMAGNLITLFIFYELLTLSTYPLVVHRGTEQALRAGATYLRYTLCGSAVLLLGILSLYSLAGSPDFIEGGVLGQSGIEDRTRLRLIFVLLVAGFGVKAALVPLHRWLPKAMVAPAPVSALLHAVAVVKAGAFGIVRVVYEVYGVEFAHQLGVTTGLAIVAAFTIVYGSLLALRQDDLKRRLAFSTVSQVSYIALGVAVAGPIATIGGIVHLVHQGLMKITLFFCAGNFAETLGVHKVSEMDGVGRRMPWTAGAFTLGAFGMIGLPPMAGFITKWYLGLGSLEAGQPWVIAVLAASTLLNAAYFLPILYRAWFLPPPAAWPHEVPRGRLETGWMLLLPPVITAALSLAVGLLAGLEISPLRWASLIADREYF